MCITELSSLGGAGLMHAQNDAQPVSVDLSYLKQVKLISWNYIMAAFRAMAAIQTRQADSGCVRIYMSI